MPEDQVPQSNGDAGGKSIKEAAASLFDAVKGPVFWFAVGYGVCKYMDRKKS